MAKNTIGETLSKEAKMSLRSSDEPARPQFVQIPAGHVVVDDESEFFVMHCTASGAPEPQISWSFNGHPLDDNTDRVHIFENGTMVIHNPIEEDEGTYICEATNYLGSISTVANYKINGKKNVNSYLIANQKLCVPKSQSFLSQYHHVPIFHHSIFTIYLSLLFILLSLVPNYKNIHKKMQQTKRES